MPVLGCMSLFTVLPGKSALSDETRMRRHMDQHDVTVVQHDSGRYPEHPPFHPAVEYPETPLRIAASEQNSAYDYVRELFQVSGYDAPAFGTPQWNPLAWLIRPGDTVFLKPNMIAHKHAHSNDWNYVITHGSIVRAVVDYTYLALKGAGRIIVGDSPQSDSRFDLIVSRMGLRAIQELYWEKKSFEIEIIDLRDEFWVERDGIYVETVRLPGDPRGSLTLDLAGDSMFAELDGLGKRYYGAFYNVEETNAHHHDGKHEYAISRTPIAADVFINLPKLKTHKKCGITINLKGLVGINANKNWLPHYAFGVPSAGGDQFADGRAKEQLENAIVLAAKRRLLKQNPMFKQVARKLKRIGYKLFGDTENVIRSGNWHGNDTVWRMCLDLNRILMYASPNGTMRDTAKRYLSIVDGIYAMEGNGPVAGTLKRAGLVVGGCNPVAVDAVCANLMGFDLRRLPLVERAFEHHLYPLADFALEEVRVRSNVEIWNRPLCNLEISSGFAFKPHFGWTGHVERRS
jgi:uncharacterized protein (DUF362 family)